MHQDYVTDCGNYEYNILYNLQAPTWDGERMVVEVDEVAVEINDAN